MLGVKSQEEADAAQDLEDAQANEKRAQAEKQGRDSSATASANASNIQDKANDTAANANTIDGQPGEVRKDSAFKRGWNAIKNARQKIIK